MKSIFILIFLSVVISSCDQNQLILSENSVVGRWECISGCDAEFYVFSKSKKGFEYITYKDQKILQAGSFSLQDTVLTLFYPDGVSDIFLVELRNDSLVLNSGALVLKFIAGQKNNSNNTEIMFVELESLLRVFPEFDLSKHDPIDFTYKIEIFDGQFETITISGIKIETSVKLAGDFLHPSDVLEKISSVLIEQGFEIDKNNYSENCESYTNENMVVLVCSSEIINEGSQNTLNLIVKFGFIK